MNLGGIQNDERPRAKGGAMYQRTRDSSASFRSFDPHPSSQAFRPAKRGARLDSDLNPVVHLSRIVESIRYSAVTEERNRLGCEIHDTLAQQFAGILLHLEAANGLELGGNACECLARARELAKSGLEDAHRMLLGLRPKSLEGADLREALRQLAQGFARDCGILCIFNATGQAQALPKEIENELYRVAQEALCNVRKYSRAGSVSILLNYTSPEVVLAIKDNGQGFEMKPPQPGARGFGLSSMCERASRLGARVDINSEQGKGTEIRMSVPLSGKALREGSNR